MEPEVHMFFDGGSRGNPGPSGCGCWIKCGELIFGEYEYLETQTNNVAEYSGLLLGLKNLTKYKEYKIKVHGDSKLVIEQIKGAWKVKAAHLIPFWSKAQDIIKEFKNIEFVHIDRSLNSKADLLANMAINTKSSKLLHNF